MSKPTNRICLHSEAEFPHFRNDFKVDACEQKLLVSVWPGVFI